MRTAPAPQKVSLDCGARLLCEKLAKNRTGALTYARPARIAFGLGAFVYCTVTTSSAAEPNLIGTWNVKFHIDEAALAQAIEKAEAQRSPALQQMSAVIRTMTDTLTVNENGP